MGVSKGDNVAESSREGSKQPKEATQCNVPPGANDSSEDWMAFPTFDLNRNIKIIDWASPYVSPFPSTGPSGILLWALEGPSDKKSELTFPLENKPMEDILLRYQLQTSEEILRIAQAQTEIFNRGIAAVTRSVKEGTSQQHDDHQEILARCARMESLLEKSREENINLRKLLDKAYPVDKLTAIAGASLFAFAVSILGTIFLQVQIIHPVLAAIGIMGSGGFLCLARWRKSNVG